MALANADSGAKLSLKATSKFFEQPIRGARSGKYNSLARMFCCAPGKRPQAVEKGSSHLLGAAGPSPQGVTYLETNMTNILALLSYPSKIHLVGWTLVFVDEVPSLVFDILRELGWHPAAEHAVAFALSFTAMLVASGFSSVRLRKLTEPAHVS